MIANTKGFTGHAMGTGIEDVVAVKALETGCVPPVANFKEVDPELGPLNLSKGGAYPVEYALRLGAGFGSQISMTLLRRVASKDGARPTPNALGLHAIASPIPVAWKNWLDRIAGHPARNWRSCIARFVCAMRALPAAAQVEAALPVAHAPLPRLFLPRQRSPRFEADPVEQRILALVARKDRLPADMLDLDLDLEADLGVDTVKQAEMFAAIRETYDIPRDDKLKLRDFPTLAHVIQFVHDRVGQGFGPAAALSSGVERSAESESRAEARPQAGRPAPHTSDPVQEQVLDLVAEKTGYPSDMLDLDLDLEADLGVDTVKQAEMFAAIRETYNIPREPNLKLRDFPTLARVIQFVYEKRPDLAGAAVEAAPSNVVGRQVTAEAPTPAPGAAATAAEAGDPVQEKVLDIVAEKTGYPKDMLDLDLDLEADLGIDTVKQAEMFASVRAAFDIPREASLKLRDFPTLAHVIRFARADGRAWRRRQPARSRRQRPRRPSAKSPASLKRPNRSRAACRFPAAPAA